MHDHAVQLSLGELTGSIRGIEIPAMSANDNNSARVQRAKRADSQFDALKLRILDIVVALLALIVFLPLMLMIGLLVIVTNPGPAIFAHKRIGKDGKPFYCLKFRSMVCNAQERLDALLASDPAIRAEWHRTHKLQKDPRVTPLGAFLRKSSLDELPQILNVLIGDMSVVGPRPIIESEVARYGHYFPHYCSVKPGITGLWQVSGRSDTTYRRRVAMDIVYSRTRSVALNMKIMMFTIPSVVLQKGSC